MISSWEKTVDQEIREWYETLVNAKYFDHKPWQHLYDEERQMVAEMYWEDQLN